MPTRPADTHSGPISRIRIPLNMNELPQIEPSRITSSQSRADIACSPRRTDIEDQKRAEVFHEWRRHAIRFLLDLRTVEYSTVLLNNRRREPLSRPRRQAGNRPISATNTHDHAGPTLTARYYWQSTDFESLMRDYPPPPLFEQSTARMSADEIRALQNERFLARVDDAWQVPFYHKRCSDAGLEPGDIRDLDD